jgi:alkylation response protein AidB-like acyl-CoA dehydrogenase
LGGKSAGHRTIRAHRGRVAVSHAKIYTIFEGTSEIQRLVISRAISGMRIR